MSLSEQTLLDLMAYADGELDGGAAKRIEKLVSRDEEARNVLEAMQTLSDCLHVVEEETPELDIDITDTVMKSIATMPIPVDEERPRRLMRATAAGFVSFVVAIAASWALFGHHEPTEEQAAALESFKAARNAPTATAEAPQAVEPPQAVAVVEPKPKPGGVELDHVESPSHEVSVFYVPALGEGPMNGTEKASTSVVVWIGDNQRGL